jgi:hypothetical protein
MPPINDTAAALLPDWWSGFTATLAEVGLTPTLLGTLLLTFALLVVVLRRSAHRFDRFDALDRLILRDSEPPLRSGAFRRAADTPRRTG